MQGIPRVGQAVLTAFLFTVATCGTSDLLGPDAPQGINGLVFLGPQCPVESLDNPCPDLPYQAWINVKSRGERTVSRIRSAEDGRFRVGLRPGWYVLHPESGNPFPIAGDVEVEVKKNVYAEVTISFDTGIR